MPVGRCGGVNSFGVEGRLLFFTPYALHHPYPRTLCTLPSFAQIKRLRWWPMELNDQHLRSHGKIGDCEQSNNKISLQLGHNRTSNRLKNSYQYYYITDQVTSTGTNLMVFAVIKNYRQHQSCTFICGNMLITNICHLTIQCQVQCPVTLYTCFHLLGKVSKNAPVRHAFI